MTLPGVINKPKTLPAMVFFAIFAIVGLISAYHVTYLPVMKFIDSKNWVQTPCEVLSSEVASSSNTTYKAHIKYRYEWEGKYYKNDAFHLQDVYSSGYQSKLAIVQAYPPGFKFHCFVNPRNPQEAVIDKSPGLFMLFMLFPLPFLAIGLGGILYSYRAKSKNTSNPETLNDTNASTIVLKENLSPMNSFLMTLLVCIFWNGCVLLMIYNWLVPSFENGGFPLFNVLFSSVFIFLGVLLIFAVVLSFLSLFNPRISMVVFAPNLVPGKTYQLEYRFSGNIQKLADLSILLIGTEVTTYRTNKGTRTDEETIHQSTLYQEKAGLFYQNGNIEFTIPDNIMPSFLAEHNKLQWILKAQGGIRYWPDMAHEFKIVINPPEIERVESWLTL